MSTSFENRKSKIVDNDTVKYFMGLTAKDITLSFIRNSFAATNKRPAKFNSWDLIPFTQTSLESINHQFKGHKLDPKKRYELTIGSFIAHLFLFENPELHSVLPILDMDWDKNVIDNINKTLAFYLVDGSISTQTYRDFINRIHWLGLAPCKYFIPSFDIGSLMMLPEVRILRDKLLAENKEAIESNDIGVMEQIVKTLLAEAKRVLEIQKPVGYELFLSGVANFGNHYKNVSVMRGLLPTSADHAKFNFCTSSLVDGIDKSEVHKFADLMVLASVARSISTQEGGYIGKMFNAAFQHLKIGPKDSDCGTTLYEEVFLTKNNIRDYHLQYVVEKDKKTGTIELASLNAKNMDKYIDKNVSIRSPLYCNGKDFCNKCAGDLYYNIGIRAVGLVSSRMASKLLNAALKFFHNTSVKSGKIDFNSNLVKIEMKEVK